MAIKLESTRLGTSIQADTLSSTEHISDVAFPYQQRVDSTMDGNTTTTSMDRRVRFGDAHEGFLPPLYRHELAVAPRVCVCSGWAQQ